jgi:hypothetical protein
MNTGGYIRVSGKNADRKNIVRWASDLIKIIKSDGYTVKVTDISVAPHGLPSGVEVRLSPDSPIIFHIAVTLAPPSVGRTVEKERG